MFHPPLWTKFIRIFAKNLFILMDNPGVRANAGLYRISM